MLIKNRTTVIIVLLLFIYQVAQSTHERIESLQTAAEDRDKQNTTLKVASFGFYYLFILQSK